MDALYQLSYRGIFFRHSEGLYQGYTCLTRALEGGLHAACYFLVCYTSTMPTFSFDIVSTYDKAEMTNVFSQTQKEISTRYDFKGTPANIEWIGDKTGMKISGAGDWQVENIIDILRKKLAARNQSSKSLDLEKEIVTANLKSTKEIPFVEGLTQDKAKLITALIREKAPKAKGLIQGDIVRVTSSSKDELQNVMQIVQSHDFDFATNFENYR
jgi:uncharacterized protein YajQ (UPF0234 family)